MFVEIIPIYYNELIDFNSIFLKVCLTVGNRKQKTNGLCNL
jgi:hypothetical protein